MRFLFKYATRGRPDLFQSTFGKWRDFASGLHQIQWLVSMDYNDSKMNDDNMRAFIDSQKNVTYCYGENSGKVDAINANMSCIGNEWDILICISDDMIPQVQGYDDIIAKKMQECFPSLDGALHFNDGRTNLIITLSIMGKGLYDKFGYIYHPDYVSLWCLPGDSLVYMANQSLKPISNIKTGDIVVGTGLLKQGGEIKEPQTKLVPSTVTAVHTRFAPIIKVYLESGAVIKCTKDHQWGYDIQRCPNGNYGIAEIGRKLVRVHQLPGSPEIGSERELGWLAGTPDQIIKIEDDGEEQVFCLTTETGNFVADGLLSHNCDNEFTDVVKAWNKYAYVPDVIIQHAWVDVTGQDILHSKNESYYDRDRKVYEARKAAGFPAHTVQAHPNPSRARFIDQRRREISHRRRP